MSSSNASNADILTLFSQTKNFVPENADRRPSTFLTLAPATSASYPQPRKSSIDASAAAAAAAAAVAATTTETIASAPLSEADLKQRRSSSLSSTNSAKNGASGFRFLKLGPVHWGEHINDHHQLDWNEAAVE